MWPYWILFVFPALQAISRLKQVQPLSGQRWSVLWCFVFVLLVLMIGLRHSVGGDWGSYSENLESITNLPIGEALRGKGDPADSLLNWVAGQSGLGIYLVNSVYGALFSWGLLVFCREQQRPWLALTIAVPYLITVVGMGYSRQGVAIGLIMLGLVALKNKSVFKFMLWVALAATFHKSAVIMFPMAVLGGSRRPVLTLFWVCVTTFILFVLILQESVDELFLNYVGAKYESSGAAIRVAMNAFPAMIFLLMRKRFEMASAQRSFWTWLAWGALAFVALLYVSPSSTAVDRVALYWIPLQLYVLSRVPDAFGKPGARNALWVYAVVGYSATVHFVWLFFATHSGYWLPYQFYPWVWLWL
jgi:hypothetical protein